MPHELDDCPHNETFKHISDTLNRLDKHTERSALAMEEIARQGGIIQNHENRLSKSESDVSEAFRQIRHIDDSCAIDSDVKDLDERLREIELVHAKEQGVNCILQKRTKFWDGVKQQMTPYVISGLLFIMYLIDKMNWFQKLLKIWHDFKNAN